MGNIEVTNGKTTRLVHDSPNSLAKYEAAGFTAKTSKKSDKKSEEN